MTWGEYLYEADVDCEIDIAEEDLDPETSIHLNIHDWGVEYSDELWYVWDMIHSYLRDAFLEYTLLTECSFTEFEHFCYSDDYILEPSTYCIFTDQLRYIWSKIQDYLYTNRLNEEILTNTTFENFVDFVMMHSK